MRLGVHAPQLGGGRVPRAEDLELRLEGRLPQAATHRVEPLRPLGMAAARVVLTKDGIVVEEYARYRFPAK